MGRGTAYSLRILYLKMNKLSGSCKPLSPDMDPEFCGSTWNRCGTTFSPQGWPPIVQRAWQRCKPWRCTSLGMINIWGNVAQTIINHPAVITISIGGMLPFPHGWRMTLFCPHEFRTFTSENEDLALESTRATSKITAIVSSM